MDWVKINKALSRAFTESEQAYVFNPGSYTANAFASITIAWREFERPKVDPRKAMG